MLSMLKMRSTSLFRQAKSSVDIRIRFPQSPLHYWRFGMFFAYTTSPIASTGDGHS